MTKRFRLSDSDARDYIGQRVDPRGMQSYRRIYEQSWIRWAAFYNGKQHFVQDGYKLRVPNLPPHRVLYKADLLSGLVDTAVAKVLSTRVAFRTPPVDGTKAARDAAKVSDMVFDYLREETDWYALQELAWTWAAICGSGFQQIAWDPLKGPMDRFYFDSMKSKKPIAPSALSEDEIRAKEFSGQFEDRAQGDISVYDWNPFQLHWDWRARERGIDMNCRWIATRQLIDIDSLADVWGWEKIKDVRPVDFDSEGTYFEEILAFMASGSTTPVAAYAIPKDKRNNQTIYTQLYERPSISNGWYGRLLQVANDVVLSNGDNPYRILEREVPGASLPFLKYDWAIRAGSFIGRGLVERLTSPQYQHNAARAVTTEHQNIYGHPSMFVPKGSGIPTGHMTIQPGVTYEYNPRPGVKPVEVGPVPQLPKEVGENASRSLAEMQMIASQSEPDMGRLPGSIRGAPAMEMMLQEKHANLQPTAARNVRNTVRGGRLMLGMAKVFYTTERTIRVVGEDNQIRVVSFMASDLQTDVRVVGEPGYFHSAASERAKILEYVQAGVFDPQNNPDDKASVLKALAYGTADEAIAERLQDEENQEEEIQMMLRNPERYAQPGVGPEGPRQMSGMPTQPWDDDAAHSRVLRRFLKSREARALHPIQVQLLSQHLQEHQMKLQQMMMQQMAMAEAQKGMPGAKGQPSRPNQQGVAR